MNFASRPFRRFAFSCVRALTSFLLPLLAPGSLTAAVIDARWTGGGGTSSYTTPANWDIGQAPFNNATDQFNVFIPGGANVSFDPFSSGGTVQGFSLGLDATFSISPWAGF